MIYLKTIFSSPSEIKYIKLNLDESIGFVDKVIICEFNRTHTGLSRKLIFEDYKFEFTEKQLERIIYLGVDISTLSITAFNDEVSAHKNERLMRGYFTKLIQLNKKDIIFSVDADEIIFNQYYEEIIYKLLKPSLLWKSKCYRLPMKQFFYKINYLWQDVKFSSAIVCEASYFLKKNFPAQWRDEGILYPKYVGSHYSWCIPVEEMVKKLNNYAHQEQFSHLANIELMNQAIRKMEYPFDHNRDFRLKRIDINNSNWFPKSLLKNIDSFSDVIGD